MLTINQKSKHIMDVECTVCKHVGNSDTMIDQNDQWFHGSCFVKNFGSSSITTLPKSKTDRLSIGDVELIAWLDIIEYLKHFWLKIISYFKP